jgi:hypothetical protein
MVLEKRWGFHGLLKKPSVWQKQGHDPRGCGKLSGSYPGALSDGATTAGKLDRL